MDVCRIRRGNELVHGHLFHGGVLSGSPFSLFLPLSLSLSLSHSLFYAKSPQHPGFGYIRCLVQSRLRRFSPPPVHAGYVPAGTDRFAPVAGME